MRITLITTIVYTLACAASAATYHISPNGNDLADGLSPETAWATLEKASATAYAPGTEVLFERGGQWRGRLTASSSGTAAQPITYGAYGVGAKPIFRGSDVIDKNNLALLDGTTSTYTQTLPSVGSVLANGTFLANAWLNNGQTSNATLAIDYVKATPNSYYYHAAAGKLYLNPGGEITQDSRQFTAVTRGDLVNSNYKNNLIFRDLVVDECAFYNAGYAFRITNSTNVQLLDSEAYRAGKHHFGVINTTGFLGKGLKASFAMPAQGVGGASALVSYSDHNHLNQYSEWEDVEITDLGDSTYPAWLSHGEGIAGITLKNIRSQGHAMLVSNFTTAEDLHVDNAGLIVHEATVNRATLTGANAKITFGVNGAVSNALIDGYYRTSGFASPIIVNGIGNKLEFSTISTALTGQVDALLAYQNLAGTLDMNGVMFHNPRGPIMISSAASLSDANLSGDYNVYHNVSFKIGYSNPALTSAQWQALVNADAHSLLGTPQFVNAAGGDYRLTAASLGANLTPIGLLGPLSQRDLKGLLRSTGEFADAGALESPTISADFDRDGDVDGADFLAWQAGWGVASGAALSQGNADADHDVDAADLHAWLQSFAQSHSNAAPIPEPKSLGLWLVALVGAWSLACRS